MRYLTTYDLFEAISIDDYEDFISKWKKSGGYVSKGSVKKLGEIGIGHDKFNKLREDISKCYQFYEMNDIDLLSDLLLDAFDESPLIPARSANYSFGLICEGDYSDGINIEIITSLNSEGKLINKWMSSSHESLVSMDSVFEDIMRNVINNRNSKIESEEKELSDLIDKKSKGLDRWGKPVTTRSRIREYDIGSSKEKIRLLKMRTPFRSLKIKPIIYIDAEIVNSDEVDWTERRNEIYNVRHEFVNNVRGCIPRYLSAIGLQNMDQRVSISEDSSMSYQKLRLKVTVDLWPNTRW